jgi:hypothetical protein
LPGVNASAWKSQRRGIQKAARIAAMQKARPDTPIC